MRTEAKTINRTGEQLIVAGTHSIYQDFIAWANRMDYYRLIILVATILFQGCVTVPFTMWSMYAATGYSDLQMSVITIASFAVLVTNLSVQPARVTIPVFGIVTIAQIWVIVYNVLYLI